VKFYNVSKYNLFSVAQFIYLMSDYPPFFIPTGIWAILQYFKARNLAHSPFFLLLLPGWPENTALNLACSGGYMGENDSDSI
jgi:hypothetical protein